MSMTDERIKKTHTIIHTYIHTYIHQYYSAIKKNEIMPFAATRIDLEIIILNEVNQKDKDKYHMYHLHMESKIWHK